MERTFGGTGCRPWCITCLSELTGHLRGRTRPRRTRRPIPVRRPLGPVSGEPGIVERTDATAIGVRREGEKGPQGRLTNRCSVHGRPPGRSGMMGLEGAAGQRFRELVELHPHQAGRPARQHPPQVRRREPGPGAVHRNLDGLFLIKEDLSE